MYRHDRLKISCRPSEGVALCITVGTRASCENFGGADDNDESPVIVIVAQSVHSLVQ